MGHPALSQMDSGPTPKRHDTTVLVLQNKAGAEKWPASDAFFSELKNVWEGSHFDVHDEG